MKDADQEYREHPLVGVARKLATGDENSGYVFSAEAIATLESLLLDDVTKETLASAIVGLFALAQGLYDLGSHDGARALVELVTRAGMERLKIRRTVALAGA